VFLKLASERNAQKRDKQKTKPRKIGFGFLVDFCVRTFRHDLFCKKKRCGVLQLPSRRNTQKRVFFSTSLGEDFRMGNPGRVRDQQSGRADVFLAPLAAIKTTQSKPEYLTAELWWY
jgi:hypothetical protein